MDAAEIRHQSFSRRIRQAKSMATGQAPVLSFASPRRMLSGQAWNLPQKISTRNQSPQMVLSGRTDHYQPAAGLPVCSSFRNSDWGRINHDKSSRVSKPGSRSRHYQKRYWTSRGLALDQTTNFSGYSSPDHAHGNASQPAWEMYAYNLLFSRFSWSYIRLTGVEGVRTRAPEWIAPSHRLWFLSKKAVSTQDGDWPSIKTWADCLQNIPKGGVCHENW